MAAVDLSQAYSLLYDLAVRRGRYVPAQLAGLASGAKSASDSLSAQQAQFSQWLLRARDALGRDDDDSLAEALIHLRMAAMDIATDFDNSVDEVGFLFERGSVRGDPAIGRSRSQDA